jgi:pimeloyl-ACP methyl ester carboxylesterase
MLWSFGMANKRKWIWIRGLVRWSVHWGDFVEEFKKKFPDDDILLLDLPGFGEFNNQASPSTMDGVIEHLDSRVDWTNGKYHVLAFSLGAMIAAQWAVKRADKMEKLFLINTSDSRSPFYHRFHVRNLWLLFSRLVYIDANFVESGILDIVSNRPEVRKRFLVEFVQAFKKNPFTRQNFMSQLRIASKARFPSAAPVKTIFVNSTADRLVNHKCSERIAQDWGSLVETHKQAGHDLTLDDSSWVLKTIQKHLSER